MCAPIQAVAVSAAKKRKKTVTKTTDKDCLYFPIWTSIRDDPKLKDFEREMGDRNAGFDLVRLWSYCTVYFKDGRCPEHLIEATACQWTGQPGVLLAAMKKTKWLDSDGRCNNWDEWAGAFLAQLEARRKRDRKRKSAQRQKRGSAPEADQDGASVPRDIQWTSRGQSSSYSYSCSSSNPEDRGTGKETPLADSPASEPPKPPTGIADIGKDPAKLSASKSRQDVIDHFRSRYLSYHPKFSGFPFHPASDEHDAAEKLIQRFGFDRLKEVIDFVVSDSPDWVGWAASIVSLSDLWRKADRVEGQLVAQERKRNAPKKAKQVSDDEAIMAAERERKAEEAYEAKRWDELEAQIVNLSDDEKHEARRELHEELARR